MTKLQFNSAYYRKFYFNSASRVTTAAEMATRAQLVAAALRHACIPVRSILDAGCGIGLLKKPFAKALPRARYHGLESSDYLCKRYAWIRGSVVTYQPRTPSDLVVCYDVLQYLTNPEALSAISNLAKLTRSALYFSALTCDDWRMYCDQLRTDRAVHLRTKVWYWRHLKKHFSYLGFGIWVRKNITPILWDLETS